MNKVDIGRLILEAELYARLAQNKMGKVLTALETLYVLLDDEIMAAIAEGADGELVSEDEVWEHLNNVDAK